jgi:hypothetical protein
MTASSVLSPALLLFGSQALSFHEESFEYLKARLDTKNHDWALQTITELPHWWNTLVLEFPHIQTLGGQELLTGLIQWSLTGSLSWLSMPIPNFILTPLVVLVQLIQYECCFSCRENANYQDIQVVGFCTGLLSAAAVAASKNGEEFRQNASKAVRLAMIIGAFVDAQSISVGESKSFSVAWTSLESRQSLTEILETFPKASSPQCYRFFFLLNLTFY